MMEIDGSKGEGGGQIIRSSLALSAVTGQPIRITHIRAGRKKPGLMRQHLTAVRAATEVCGAEVVGDAIGSRELSFSPGPIVAGDFAFEVGTAGSTMLVAQTVLPALMLANGPSTLSLRGGTHNPWAPPYHFFQNAFVSQLHRCGPKVKSVLHRPGFYPAGGGHVELSITPAMQLRGWDVLSREGEMRSAVTAIVSAIPRSVADRECDTIRRKTGWPSKQFHVIEVDDPAGPGNVVMIELAWDNVTEVFIGFGKPGVKAEHVARGVLRQARAHIASEVPVGEYLADQLMMPMGLAASQGHASSFVTGPLSMHSQTHLDVLKLFLDLNVTITQASEQQVLVQFEKGG